MAAEVQHDEGPPLTELESLQLKSNQITDESLESTRRMIAMCEDVSRVMATENTVDGDGDGHFVEMFFIGKRAQTCVFSPLICCLQSMLS